MFYAIKKCIEIYNTVEIFEYIFVFFAWATCSIRYLKRMCSVQNYWCSASNALEVQVFFCSLLSAPQKLKSYYPALKASGRDSILKEPPPSSNSISNKIRTKDKLSDNQRCFFCEIPQEQWANNPLEDKTPITSTKCKSL